MNSRHSHSPPMRLLAALIMAFIAVSTVRAADDLTPYSDEFRSAGTQANWLRIHQIEGWGNDVLSIFDIGQRRPGRLVMIPHSSTWYAEWRGELTYKLVAGDFVVTTDVEVSRRGGGGPPRASFSLAGIMVRAPRAMTTPAQWTPGGQNYVFLSLGAANTPGTYQLEVKTTVNSVSTLEISPGASRAQIQVARVGRHLILLRRLAGGAWVVHRRYSRPDFPAALQAGLTVYTDWPSCERVGYAAHNTGVLTNGARLSNGMTVSGATPDLEAAFDYARFARPRVPSALVNADLSNPAVVTDEQLLAFLGDLAHEPPMPLELRADAAGGRLVVSYPGGEAVEAHRLDRMQLRATNRLGTHPPAWEIVPLALQVEAGNTHFVVPPASAGAERYYVASELP